MYMKAECVYAEWNHFILKWKAGLFKKIVSILKGKKHPLNILSASQLRLKYKALCGDHLIQLV